MSFVTVTIDGQDVQVPADATVLEACEQAGKRIPTLCYQKDLTITGSCRVCVVEIENAKNLPASCAQPVADGMVVHTNTEKVREARKMVLELMWANHPNDCLTCESNGNCKLQDYCYEYGVSESRFEGEVTEHEIDDSSRFVERHLDKCILCGRCIGVCQDIQNSEAIDFMGRGFQTKVATFYDRGLDDSTCVNCGNCISVCPVGALSAQPYKGLGREYDVEKVKTTCPYCGVGCNFNLNVKDGEIVGVSEAEDAVVNNGYLCVKGRFGVDFVHSDERLTKPLVRKNGELVETDWEEALDKISENLTKIKKEKGPDAIGFLASAKCTNEDNYVLQKFARAVVGTNNIDHCARL